MRKWSRLALLRAGPFSIFAFNPGLQLLVKKVAEKFDDILASGVGHLGIIGDRDATFDTGVVEGGGLACLSVDDHALWLLYEAAFAPGRRAQRLDALSETGSLPEIKPRPRLRFPPQRTLPHGIVASQKWPTADLGYPINSHASKSHRLRLHPEDEPSASAVVQQSRQTASGPW